MRRITAMTPFLVLLSVFVLAELVAGVQIFRHDRPTAPPPSHQDWSSAPTSETTGAPGAGRSA
jgi:hypothetical protein